MVEFAMIIMLFMTIVVAIIEFSFLFTSYLSVTFASRDAVQMAATYGNADGSDAAVLERVRQDITTPANSAQIKTVEIYLVDTSSSTSSPVGGAITTYTYDGGSHKFTKPDGTDIYLPFTGPAPDGYPEASRCNVNMGLGCEPKTTVDTVAVRITYQYKWITPFPQIIAGSGSGPLLVQFSTMRLEPIR